MLYKEEYYRIVGIAMEVHRALGGGLAEGIYKDALEYEFKDQGIPFSREKPYFVLYKGKILNHIYYADFVVFDDIILEVKAAREISPDHYSQVINYLHLADSRLGILVNFNIRTLQHKRVIV